MANWKSYKVLLRSQLPTSVAIPTTCADNSWLVVECCRGDIKKVSLGVDDALLATSVAAKLWGAYLDGLGDGIKEASK